MTTKIKIGKTQKYSAVFSSSKEKKDSIRAAKTVFKNAGFYKEFLVLENLVTNLLGGVIESQKSRIVVWSLVDGKKKRVLSFEPSITKNTLSWYTAPIIEKKENRNIWYANNTKENLQQLLSLFLLL